MVHTRYRLPNLFIPGAGKSGTSSLHQLLDAHPDICMSTKKEPHFWVKQAFEGYTQEDYKEYNYLFTDKKATYQGESSTGYMCFPNFIERIKAHYKSAPKFIFLLRNPIDRIYSHYWWLRGMGSEDLPFREAVLRDFDTPPDITQKLPEANYKNYYQFGLYGNWLNRFYQAFDKQDILVLTTENLAKEKEKTLNSCFRFLKLPPLINPPEASANPSKILRFPKLYKYAKKLTWGDYKLKRLAKPFVPKPMRTALHKNLHETVRKLTATDKTYPPISPEDRLWLKRLYAEDVALLKQLTKQDFAVWQDFV